MTYVKFRQPVSKSFNNLVDNILPHFPSLFRDEFAAPAAQPSLPVNIKESEGGYQLEVYAPGFSKEEFRVDIDKNLLTITAERKAEGEQKEEKYLRKEFKLQPAKRTFILDETLDTEKVDAKHVNGVLTVNLYRKEPAKVPVKQITIQ
ncbi:Hsp20/alpha crystallin family protein [Paraflavisolibacter sp. H34]|uniref:Hsp20/alpha crystallin family protein n=1 Tax=Huijunlia imazamoxiresistens TaxID=3127457 RepID=UPI003018EEC3